MAVKILVVDDKPIMRDSVAATLQRANYQVVAAGSGVDALKMVDRHQPAVVITDLRMPEMDGLQLLTSLREREPEMPVVLMTAYGAVDVAVDAMKAGAFDFIQKPFENEHLVMTVRRAVEHRRLSRENRALRSTQTPDPGSPQGAGLVGDTPVIRLLKQQVMQIAQSHGTVLVAGPSGAGKEVVARMIHANSPRHDAVLLAVNCAALSESLLESELFGHEKGAFTGADQTRKGRFELADGGTLLLDEISEISPGLQAKLLRVLQERQFERVGSSTPIDVDVRIIATTNRDLAQYVREGSFRQDLYYRLNVLPIALPSLAQRVDDIPALAEHFLNKVAMREGRPARRFDADALAALKAYAWPGNVRELYNICERASVLAPGDVIQADLIAPWLTPMTTPDARADADGRASGAGSMADTFTPSVTMTLEEMERQQILRVLGEHGGNRARSAQALGIGVRTLGLKLKKWKEQRLVAQTV